MPLLESVPYCRFSKVKQCGQTYISNLDIFGQAIGLIETCFVIQGLATLFYVNYVKRARIAKDSMMAGATTVKSQTSFTQLEWFLVTLLGCTTCAAISTTTSSFVGMPTIAYFTLFSFMELLAYLSMLVYVDMVLRTTTTTSATNKSLTSLRTLWLRLLIIPSILTAILVIISGSLSESDTPVSYLGIIEFSAVAFTGLAYVALLVLLYKGRRAFTTYLKQAEQAASGSSLSGSSGSALSASELQSGNVKGYEANHQTSAYASYGNNNAIAYPPNAPSQVLVVDYANNSSNNNNTSDVKLGSATSTTSYTTTYSSYYNSAGKEGYPKSTPPTPSALHPFSSQPQRLPVNSQGFASTASVSPQAMVAISEKPSSGGSHGTSTNNNYNFNAARSRSNSTSNGMSGNSPRRTRQDALVTAIKSAIQTLNWLLTIAWFVTGYTFAFNLILFVIGLGAPLYFVTMAVYGLPALLSSAVFFVIARQSYSKWQDMREMN